MWSDVFLAAIIFPEAVSEIIKIKNYVRILFQTESEAPAVFVSAKCCYCSFYDSFKIEKCPYYLGLESLGSECMHAGHNPCAVLSHSFLLFCKILALTFSADI